MPLFKMLAIAEAVAEDTDVEPYSEITGVLEDVEERRRRILNFHFMRFEQEKGRVLYTKGLEVTRYFVDADVSPGYAGTYLH